MHSFASPWEGIENSPASWARDSPSQVHSGWASDLRFALTERLPPCSYRHGVAGNGHFSPLQVTSLARRTILLLVQNAGALPLVRQAIPANASTTTINYQGRLADASGMPIDGQVTLQFALYATDVDPNPVWGPETHPNVPVSNGLFSVILGAQSGGIPQTILGGDLWLEIIVEGETLAPRERLGAVPYAMQAREALTVPDRAIGSRNFAPSWYEDSNPSTVETSSTQPVPTDVSVTFTCDVDCTALILHRGLVKHSVTDGRTDVEIYVDGNTVFREVGVVNVKTDGGSPAASRYHATEGFDFVNLPAGTHVVDVRFECMTTGTCYYYGDGSGVYEHLNVLLFAQP